MSSSFDPSFDQTSVFASSRAVPRRVLLVDDDANLLEQLAATLGAREIEVIRATTGEEAITLMARRWIPLIVTDDQMPEMDGIALVHRVRALAAKPTYVIMMGAAIDGEAMERGYCAGVDQYVSKKNWEAVLPVRVTEGLKTIHLRRIGRHRIAHESVVTVDLHSGAHTARHLVGRLSAEIMLAQRTQGVVNVLSLGVHSPHKEQVTEEQLSATLGALKSALRPKLDWVAWLHAAADSHRFAVILPSPASDADVFVQSVHNAFVSSAKSQTGQAPVLTFGTTSVQPAPNSRLPTAMEVLGKAESARRVQQGTAMPPH